MDATLVPLLLLMPPLLVLSGMFSGAETALFGLTATDRLAVKRSHPSASVALGRLLSQPRRLLITILLLNTSVNVLYFVLGSVIVLRAEPAVGVPINIASLVALILFGEVLAKLLAGSRRVSYSVLLARPLVGVFGVLTPLLRGIDRFAVGPLTRLIRPAASGESELTLEELGALIDLGVAEGAIDEREQTLLADVIELGSVRVREVMTPRPSMRWLPTSFDHESLVALVRASGVERVPVCDASIDEVRGMLDVRAYLGDRAAGQLRGLDRYLEAPVYTPESVTLDRLLAQLRGTGTDASIVVDEHGAIVGIVRIEDAVRSLVSGGSAVSEQSGGPADVRMVGLGRWSVPGELGVRAWSELFGQRIEHRAATIGGLVVAFLGRMPRVGDSVVVGNVRLSVETVSGRVIARVLVAHLDAPELPGDGADAGAGS